MKLAKILLFTLSPLLFIQCQREGIQLNGKIANAANMKAEMEMLLLNGNSIAKGKADIDSGGNFKIDLKEKLDPGLYRIKIGIKPIFLIFDGKESDVSIEGDFNTIEKFEAKIEGSKTCEYYTKSMKSFVLNPTMPTTDIEKMVLEAPTAICAAIISFQTLPTPDASSLVFLKKVKEKLDREAPNTNYSIHYTQGIAQLEREIMGSGGVNIGSMAPDIALPDPKGVVRKLSDLRGKLVLLDFWASWCRPCRMENPNVVKAYNKYKSKGFTVFSVSLDGISLQNRSRMEPASVEKALVDAKRNWTDAIKQDGLPWENHVSDLQQWDAAPAVQYGVQSIPQTFLIDKDGKIISVNPRANLEQELEKFLK
ncbi:MAG: peroxiredoxin family protein [Saprospiraceae bacterium]